MPIRLIWTVHINHSKKIQQVSDLRMLLKLSAKIQEKVITYTLQKKHIKDLLRKQNTKFQDVEAERECLIAKHKAKQNAIQNEVNESKSKVSNLMSEVQDRDIQISAFERKVKSILEERDDIQLQLMESNRPARADEWNSHLQTKLDEADDAIRKA